MTTKEPRTPYQKLTARIEKALEELELLRNETIKEAKHAPYAGCRGAVLQVEADAYRDAILMIREAMNPRKK